MVEEVESDDDWRQAIVTIIGFIQVGIQVLVFCTYVGYEGYYDIATRRVMLILCVPQAVASLMLIKGGLEKKAILFVPWLLTTLIMLVTQVTYMAGENYTESKLLLSVVVVFTICSYVLVYHIGSFFHHTSKSLPHHDVIESNSYNDQDYFRRITPRPIDMIGTYSVTDEETEATAPRVVADSPEATAYHTTDISDRYLLSSRHNSPTAPTTDVPESAAITINTTANNADEPPSYDEVVAKVPYCPYAYPVPGPVAAANPPYPVTFPIGMPSLPYPIADSVAAPNPPYPLGDPVGAPTSQQPVAGPSDVSYLGWRTDLFPDNTKT